MEWLNDNWALVVLAWGNGNYFNSLINPLGLAISGLFLIIGVLWAKGRKTVMLTLFATWVLIPLHHFTIEHANVDAGSVGGFGGVALFFAGLIAVIGVIVYFVFVRE